MVNLVVLHWRNKRTGQTGHGQPVDGETAMEWVEWANREYPFIEHWTEPAPDDPRLN